MQTILVPVRGSDGEERVLAAALAAARPLNAHLDFYHVEMSVGEAAENTPYVGFAMGAGLGHALDELRVDEQERATAARGRIEGFCRRHGVPLLEKPQAGAGPSASFSEQVGESMPLIMARARHSDLVVLGRVKRGDRWPATLLERLLLESGRPILVAPSRAVRTLTGTIVVLWKECREAAHALGAAMPLIRRAERVLLVSVAENDHEDALEAVNGLAAQLRWQSIRAEPRCPAARGRAVTDVLAAAVKECEPDLVVMGGYGHSRIREIIFGGCTDAFLRGGGPALLLVH